MDHNPIDSYPLSPMQRGMVADQPLHENTGLDIIQFDCAFEPDLDHDLFRAAWEWVTARHDALRTCFRWTEDGTVAQDLYRQAELAWTTVGQGPVASGEWERFVHSDRVRGFPLGRPPLARCALAPGDQVTRFAFTFHHSILDGRSMTILWREVFARYDELRGNTSGNFPEPPRYRDFIDWLERRDSSGDEPFWRELLDGFRTPTVLSGAGRADGAGPAVNHQEFDIPLPAVLSEALRALATRYDLTLNTVIQGAWAILLSRYTDRDDVVFGAVRSVRRGSVPGGENLVGLLLNTLPVRARTWDDQPLPEFLAALRAQAIAIREHQHTPLMDWRRWTEVPRGESLFDSLVAYENGSMLDALRAGSGDWARRSFRIRRQPAYPLVLQVFADAAMLMKLVYDRTRFAEETIAEMGGQLRHVLESIAADPDRRVGTVHVLTPAGTRRALVEWNPAPTDHQDHQTWGCLHDRVARRAATGPDALALAAGQRLVSHGELDRWANRIGHTLRALGVGRDQVVAVSADVSPELVAGELGVLRSGAVCLPLHPGTPPDRLAALLDALGVEVVLARWDQVASIPARVRLLDLDGGFNDAPAHDPMCGAVPDDLAFVFDRPGPDGEPMPVMIPHAAVVNLVDSASGPHRLTAADRVMLTAPPSYEASMLEIWPALVAGASLHTPGRGAGWPVERGITAAFLPAASAGHTIARLADAPGAIRTVTVVGRVFDGQVQDSPFEIRYVTGPQEGGVVSIQGGRPGANTEAYLLDRGGRPVPPGVSGELCVAGTCLARGVAGRPALTADRFRPHPFSATPGARIYHSSAAVRHTPDGRVELLGPAAPGGARPDPARIEAALRRYPSIADAAVVVTEADQAGRGAGQVAVFATARPGVEVPADEIRQAAADLLPYQGILVEVRTVAELPATPSGRLDTQALLDRVEAGTGSVTTTERPDHTPESRLATLVAQVWADVLDRGEQGRTALLSGDAGFFELGGHSMFAIAAALRLSGELDINIPARLIFDAPTVPAFTARLEKLLDAGTSGQPTKITRLPRD